MSIIAGGEAQVYIIKERVYSILCIDVWLSHMVNSDTWSVGEG